MEGLWARRSICHRSRPKEGRWTRGRTSSASARCSTRWRPVPERFRAHVGPHLAVVNAEPRPPSQLTKDLPHELERIILRCLPKDPARRVQVMADLVVDLEDLRSDRGAGPARKRPMRRPMLSAVGVLLERQPPQRDSRKTHTGSRFEAFAVFESRRVGTCFHGVLLLLTP